MKSISRNKINGFAVIAVFVFLAVSVTGCFRPETNLANRGESVSWSTDGSRSIVQSSEVDTRTEWSVRHYGPTVQSYARKYNLDWRLVLAVMRHESRFVHDAVSYRGAFGLMQIMPATQAEIANKLGVPETETPSNNIRAGVYHLQELYRSIEASDEENHIRLTLAAYNAGLNRIRDAQDVASFLGDDPSDWDAVKSALPLLSKRYQSLHTNVWRSGRPRAGYFSDWRQTMNYVESVMDHYDRYQVALK